MNHHKYVFFFLCLSVGGCATSPMDNVAQEDENTVIELENSHPNDPFEPINRWIWALNYDYLDPYLLRPMAVGYVEYVPSPIRTGFGNFISNLEEPASVVNSLIMLKPKKALMHFNRFWINSTFGLVGLIDLAGDADIKTAGDQALGDALGYHGLGNGAYFMLPLYGPMTLREGVGDVVDGLYFPLNLLTLPQSLIKSVIKGLEDRATLISQESLLNNSLDPYAFTRDAYLQYRNFKASGGKPQDEILLPDENIDNYLDEVDEVDEIDEIDEL
jgi:phospholipid-binding lipoprotein MlaA